MYQKYRALKSIHQSKKQPLISTLNTQKSEFFEESIAVKFMTVTPIGNS